MDAGRVHLHARSGTDKDLLQPLGPGRRHRQPCADLPGPTRL